MDSNSQRKVRKRNIEFYRKEKNISEQYLLCAGFNLKSKNTVLWG